MVSNAGIPHPYTCVKVDIVGTENRGWLILAEAMDQAIMVAVNQVVTEVAKK